MEIFLGEGVVKEVPKNTLFVLVTCSRDKIRDEIAEKVVNSIQDLPKDRVIAFDNSSVYQNTKEKLKSLTKNSFFSSTNYGFWTAVDWCLQNYESILKSKLDYVYVIESDAIHFPGYVESIVECEKYLENNADVGSIRLQEFSVKEKHLYDKNFPTQDSRKWAWMRQSNHFTNQKAYFERPEGSIYRTNLSPQVCSLNRISFMENAFCELRKMGKFTEIDFQEQYFKFYKESAVYDGGIFNTKESFESDTLTGSWSDKNKLQQHGYKMTREDSIQAVNEENFVNVG